MLLYITWGKYEKSHIIGTYGKKIKCPKCKNTYSQDVFHVEQWSHIMYIPVDKESKGYIRQCPICCYSEPIYNFMDSELSSQLVLEEEQSFSYIARPSGKRGKYNFYIKDDLTSQEFFVSENISKSVLKEKMKNRGIKPDKLVFEENVDGTEKATENLAEDSIVTHSIYSEETPIKEKKSKKSFIGILIALLVILVMVMGIVGVSFIKNSISLAKVGSNFDPATCKTVMIDGDIYEYPFNVEDLYNNGWEVESYRTIDYGFSSDSKSIEPLSLAKNIELVRRNNKIRVEAYNPSGKQMDLKNCLVSRLYFPDVNHPKIVMPGNYKLGGKFPAGGYKAFLVDEQSDLYSGNEEYDIPFVGADNHKCVLKVSYETNMEKTTDLEYCMMDVIVDLDPIIDDLEWNLADIFGNESAKMMVEDESGVDWSGFKNDLISEVNDKIIVDSVIYISGFDETVIKDTNGYLETFISNAESYVDWAVTKEDEDTLRISYVYPNILDKMEEAAEDTMASIDIADDVSTNQEVFDAYATRLSTVTSFDINADSMLVDVVNGEITTDDYTVIYFTLLGFGELYN